MYVIMEYNDSIYLLRERERERERLIYIDAKNL